MSARTATIGPGKPPFNVATTPVLAMPVRTSSPRGAQAIGDPASGFDLLEPELRVLVDGVANLDEGRQRAVDRGAHVAVEIGGGERRAEQHARDERGQETHQELLSRAE